MKTWLPLKLFNPLEGLRRLRDQSVMQLAQWIRLAEAREWEDRLKSLKQQLLWCGADVHLHRPIHMTGANKCTIGDNVHIGENAFIRAEGGLSIGDNTRISRNLLLYTINHRFEGELLPYEAGRDERPVSIGRNVWVGMNVCIAPGTVIGDGAVIGMGTTVAGYVPPRSIVVSAKWRIVGSRDEHIYQMLDENGQYADPSGQPYQGRIKAASSC